MDKNQLLIRYIRLRKLKVILRISRFGVRVPVGALYVAVLTPLTPIYGSQSLPNRQAFYFVCNPNPPHVHFLPDPLSPISLATPSSIPGTRAA